MLHKNLKVTDEWIKYNSNMQKEQQPEQRSGENEVELAFLPVSILQLRSRSFNA